LFSQQPPARELVHADPILRSWLVNAELILRSTFLPSRGSGQRGSTFLQSQSSLAVREHIFTYTGLIGCEGAQVLHRWAQSSDSRGHGSSQAYRQERDTDGSECEDRSPDFLWLEIRVLLCQFGYVSSEEPAAHILTVSKTLCETRTAETAGLALRD